MKIIEIDKNNPYAELIYDKLENWLYYGYEYLPFIFLHTVMYEDNKLQLPKWITKRHFDSINKPTQKLMNELEKIRITEKNLLKVKIFFK
jgi:hypothetical protein